VLPATPPLRVLVVDDGRDCADTLATLLGLWGHQARAVYDGHSALAAARAFAPDVVILDIALPGITGWEVAEQLRALPRLRGAVLLAHSGYSLEPYVSRSIEAGCDRHLAKPLDPKVLECILADLSRSLAGRRQPNPEA
jgi:CheY-like chemotaxis protein